MNCSMNMGVCFSCGGPLRDIGPGLYRCRICRQLNEVRGGVLLPRVMEVYPHVDYVREAAIEGVYEMTAAVPSESGLDPDMVVFIRRLNEVLIPLEGEDRESRARGLKVRNQLKRELTDVFEDRAEWNDWFDRWRQNLNIHSKVFAKVIFDALEGLKSPEAQQMREGFGQALQRGPY